MRLITPTRIAAAVLLAGVAMSVPAQQTGVKRIIDGGDDGKERTYQVGCRNNTNGTIYVNHETGQRCVMAQGGPRRCDRKWNLQEAAEQACASR